MRRSALALMAALALAGCSDWSRPDPRLERSAPSSGSPSESDSGSPAGASTEPSAAPVVTPAPARAVTIAALREGVAALRAGGAADEGAFAELERLETLGFDLLERGAPEVQAEAEALLEELSALRAELVDRQAPGGD